MTALVDVWRAVDVEARLLAGDPEHLRRPVRGVIRTRATPPHLPAIDSGELLVVDAAVLPEMPLERVLDVLADVGVEPAGLFVAGADPPGAASTTPAVPLSGPVSVPVLAGRLPAMALHDAARRYLDNEVATLERFALELRVAMAEAAVIDPSPSAPSAVAAARIRRGVAVSVAGRLLAVHGRAGSDPLALTFTATYRRLLAGPSRRASSERRLRNGLRIVEVPFGEEASVWLFDELPFAALDHTAAAALATTLRALLRRTAAVGVPAERPHGAPPTPPAPAAGEPDRDRLATTLLAVARANGRVATAARALGVHRNTVLYRLRQAQNELGIDPRRPDDALRLLAESTRTSKRDA